MLKVPALLLVNVTVPVGVLFVPASESLTVAVHVVETPTGTLLGEQVTLVLVDRVIAVTSAVPLEPTWLTSPE